MTKNTKNIESEKNLERSLKRTVELDIGGLCIKLLSTHLSGLPDRMCLMPRGRIIFVEVKTTKQKPRKIQLLIHKKLRKLGFVVKIVECTEDIAEIKKEYGKQI